MVKTVRGKLLIAAVAVAAVLAGFYILAFRGPPDTSGLRAAPSFTREDSSGGKVSLDAFQDQAVVLHFWASWCAPCLPELPEIQQAASRLPKDQTGRPIQWILISVDESWENAKRALDPAKLPSGVKLVLDPEGKLADEYGTYQYPETYVLDRKHRIATKWIGSQEWNAAWGERALQGIDSLSRGQLPTETPSGK